MSYFKRQAADRDVTFRRPQHECYACSDTGIVSNGDGALTELVPSYDVLDDGRRIGGYDLAMICWCHAAYNVKDLEGKITRHGFREESGAIRKISTCVLGVDREVAVGASCPQEITVELHRRRKDQWALSEGVFNDRRQLIRQGAKAENLPPLECMELARAAMRPDTWSSSDAFSTPADVLSTVAEAIIDGQEVGAHRPDKYALEEPVSPTPTESPIF